MLKLYIADITRKVILMNLILQNKKQDILNGKDEALEKAIEILKSKEL